MTKRYAMLGILTEQGYPLAHAGMLAVPPAEQAHRTELRTLPGRQCPECGNKAIIRKVGVGCDFCIDCGYTGVCGWRILRVVRRSLAARALSRASSPR